VRFIDSHCHLDNEQFDADRDAVIERALAAGVEEIVAIGTGDGPPDLEAGVRLAERYPAFYATVGVHPHDAAKATEETYLRLAALLAHPKVVAAGEMGLDYHYNLSRPDVQRAVFVEQMSIARDARKPIVIHTREAWGDTIALLQQHWAPTGVGGIMHCFSGGPREAEDTGGSQARNIVLDIRCNGVAIDGYLDSLARELRRRVGEGYAAILGQATGNDRS